MNIKQLSDRHARWKHYVELHEQNGQPQKEFCKTHNLVLSQFAYYRSLFKAKNNVISNDPPAFEPVQIKHSNIKQMTKIAEEIKIVLPNGFHCFIPLSIDCIQIKKLLGVLLSC